MRCLFIVSSFHHIPKFGKCQVQINLAPAVRCHQLLCFPFFCHTAAILAVFCQKGFDADNRIQNIRTCISLKGRKSLDIKNVIFGCLIGQIAVFQCGKAYCLGDFSRLCLFIIAVFHHFLIHFFIDLFTKCLQTENPAIPRLKRLSVFSVHRTKTDKYKSDFRSCDLCFLCHTEHLRKMQRLAFICQINDLIRLEQFLSFYNCSKIGRCIQRSTV